MGSVGKSSEYHSFPYKSDDGWEYNPDKGTTAKWFKENSNYDSLIGGMNDDERQAFKRWTEGRFMRGQQYDGFSRMTSEDQARTRAFDKVLDRSELKEPIIVHRLSTGELLAGAGFKHLSESAIASAMGKDIILKGNLSTGAGSEGLTISGWDKEIEYEIRIPAGKGRGMFVGDERINSWGDRQREFMMNRDVVVRPVSYSKAPAGSRAKYVVVLEWQSKMNEHDYS